MPEVVATIIVTSRPPKCRTDWNADCSCKKSISGEQRTTQNLWHHQFVSTGGIALCWEPNILTWFEKRKSISFFPPPANVISYKTIQMKNTVWSYIGKRCSKVRNKNMISYNTDLLNTILIWNSSKWQLTISLCVSNIRKLKSFFQKIWMILIPLNDLSIFQLILQALFHMRICVSLFRFPSNITGLSPKDSDYNILVWYIYIMKVNQRLSFGLAPSFSDICT